MVVFKKSAKHVKNVIPSKVSKANDIEGSHSAAGIKRLTATIATNATLKYKKLRTKSVALIAGAAVNKNDE